VKTVALSLLFAIACLGADKKLPEGKASNASLELRATLYTEKSDIQNLLGSDLEGYFTILEVNLVPKSGGGLRVVRDDFLLRSDKDGQRSSPFHPSQIAGSAALVVSTKRGGAIRSENAGPVWGPPMGGPPIRMGTQGPAVGNTAGEGGAEASSVRAGGDSGILKTLTDRELPEAEHTAPASGLLYFMLEGKHKVKDLELQYRGPAGRLSLRFK